MESLKIQYFYKKSGPCIHTQARAISLNHFLIINIKARETIYTVGQLFLLWGKHVIM
jgi:hypothetical protein